MSAWARQAPTSAVDGWRAVFHDTRRAVFHDTRRAVFHDTRRAVFHDTRRAVFHDTRRAAFKEGLGVARHSGRSSGAWAVGRLTLCPIAPISDAEAVPRSRMSGGRSCAWHGHLTPRCASAIWKRCG